MSGVTGGVIDEQDAVLGQGDCTVIYVLKTTFAM